MSTIKTLLTLVFLFHPGAWASTQVVTTTTDLAWLAKEIGGTHVKVQSLLKGHENPHFVDALPSFIHTASKADLFCLVGLDLEIGWAPKVLTRTGKSEIQPGGTGYWEAGKSVTSLLEVPTGHVDRSMGDMHGSGNPHFWLSPDPMAEAAEGLSLKLQEKDPAHTEEYVANTARVKTALAETKKSIENKLKTLKEKTGSMSVFQYHKEFSYFFHTYGIPIAGTLEETPGVAPSAGRIAQMAKTAKAQNIKLLIAADTAPLAILKKFTELSHVPYVLVPSSIKPESHPNSFSALQEEIVSAMEKHLHPKKP